METDDTEGGYERLGAKQAAGKMDEAKVFVKELMDSRPIKIITILVAGVTIIYISGIIFKIIGETGSAFIKMRNSWNTMPPPII